MNIRHVYLCLFTWYLSSGGILSGLVYNVDFHWTKTGKSHLFKMVAFSKPTLLNYSCYELGHTWNPSCKKSSLDVAKSVFSQSLKIYGSLFLIAGLIRKRGKSYFKKKVWQEILQSSLFLTTNGTLFLTFFCLWRKVAGFYFYLSGIICGIPACAISISIERKERKLMERFYYVNTIAAIPSLVASYVAILLERKSRRGLLAVYMGQVAIETVWRMLENRGYVKSIPHGEVLVFSIACGVYLYYFKQHNGLPDGTMSVFKKVFGPQETIPSSEICESNPTDVEMEEQSNVTETIRSNGSTAKPTLPLYHHSLRWLKACPKHHQCRHKNSCVYYVIQGTIKLFGLGYVAQAGIKFIGLIGKLLKQPKSVIRQCLLNSNNVKLGAFLGSFVGIYRAVNCMLRWFRDKDEKLHGMLAGFLAGWSMLFYKSQTVALYTAAKLAEVLYFKGIEKEMVPYIKCADTIIYSISTAIVFHAAVLEPHSLRPAYWRFLLRVTGNRFAEMNRRLIDPWVPNCSKMYPDFWPNYDPRYTNLVKPNS